MSVAREYNYVLATLSLVTPSRDDLRHVNTTKLTNQGGHQLTFSRVPLAKEDNTLDITLSHNI